MIKIRKVAPSGTIVIDRPNSHNALSRELIRQLIEAFGDFHREQSVRAVILAGSGATFCSGLDLKELKTISEENDSLEKWHDVANELQELVEVMLRFPKPIIASVDGAVFGSGIALVAACDLVVASPQTRFVVNASRFGLVSGLLTPLLAFRCGAGVASRLVLGLEALDATEAHRVGLVHHVVPSELTWAKAHEMANSIANGAAESIQMSKRLLNEMIGESLLSQLMSGSAILATACSTEAAAEGLAAFQSKRPPKFP